MEKKWLSMLLPDSKAFDVSKHIQEFLCANGAKCVASDNLENEEAMIQEEKEKRKK